MYLIYSYPDVNIILRKPEVYQIRNRFGFIVITMYHHSVNLIKNHFAGVLMVPLTDRPVFSADGRIRRQKAMRRPVVFFP